MARGETQQLFKWRSGFLKCTTNQPYSMLYIKLASNIDTCYNFNYSTGAVVHLRSSAHRHTPQCSGAPVFCQLPSSKIGKEWEAKKA